LWTVAVTVVMVCAVDCGGGSDGAAVARTDTASVTTARGPSQTTSTAAGTETRRGSWKFERRPLVVAVPHRGEIPGLDVYFKLNHKLTAGHHVVVSVNGASNYDVSGTGYDSVAGRCYFKLLDNTQQFPRSLRRVKAGQSVRVVVRITRAVPSTLSARVPAAIALPGEDEDLPGPIWLKKLGCRS
jgi:hypothetical protein